MTNRKELGAWQFIVQQGHGLLATLLEENGNTITVSATRPPICSAVVSANTSVLRIEVGLREGIIDLLSRNLLQGQKLNQQPLLLSIAPSQLFSFDTETGGSSALMGNAENDDTIHWKSDDMSSFCTDTRKIRNLTSPCWSCQKSSGPPGEGLRGGAHLQIWSIEF